MSEIDDTLREELSALLDGALPEERADELRRRLESDAALRKEYEALCRTVEAVRALPRPPAPAELRVRLERKLMAPSAAGVRRLRSRLAVAAVVTVAVGAGVLALRPTRPDPSSVHEQARQDGPADVRAVRQAPSEPPSAGKPESAGDPTRELAEAEAADAATALDEALRRAAREPGPALPEAPAEEMETSRKDVISGRLAKEKRGAPAKEGFEDDAARPMLGGAKKGEATEDDPEVSKTLLALAAMARAAPENRRPYLFQLNQLSPERVEAHLNELKHGLGATYAQAAVLPPSANLNLTVTDLDEARQIFTVLDKFPGTAGRGTAAALVTPGNGGRTPQLTAEVEVTPQQWQSVGAWLRLMDVTDARVRTPNRMEEGRGRDESKRKSRAKPEAEADEVKPSPGPVDLDAKRKVKIFIRYPRTERAAREK